MQLTLDEWTFRVSRNDLHHQKEIPQDWKWIQKQVERLQKRIYKATCRLKTARQQHNKTMISLRKKQLINIQKLVTRSWYVRWWAIHKVTALNLGRTTPGIDGLVVLNDKQRLDLARSIHINKCESTPVKRVYIPKHDGSSRPLGIPIIRDRVIQAIYKIALEPEWEAYFSTSSYGFRPGRSTHDVIMRIWMDLSGRARFGEDCYAIEADLTSAFDNIKHEYILEQLPHYFRPMIAAWLKAGVMEDGQYRNTIKGTPQGGVISPLLANMAFHFIDVLLQETDFYENARRLPWNKGGVFKGVFSIRYADDFVVLCPTKEVAERLQIVIGKAVKKELGVSLNQKKTRITHVLPQLAEIKTATAINFLGFRIKAVSPMIKRGSKKRNRVKVPFILVTPDKERMKRWYGSLKEYLQGNMNTDYEELLWGLNHRIRGWGNYYRRFHSKRDFRRMTWQIQNLMKWWVWRKSQTRSWKRWRKYVVTDYRRQFLFGTPRVTLLLLSDAPIDYYSQPTIKEVPFGGIMPEHGDIRPWMERSGVRAMKAQRRSNQSWRSWLEYGNVRYINVP